MTRAETPRAQEGSWTLTAPDGRTWTADSPLKCCSLEQRERVPAAVALQRIFDELACQRLNDEHLTRWTWPERIMLIVTIVTIAGIVAAFVMDR